MIFQHTWKLVIEGKKTLTTRRAYVHQDGFLITNGNYQVGRIYCVQKQYRGKGIDHIRILEKYFREQVQHLSKAEAIMEGFKSKQEFIDFVAKRYGENFLYRPCVRYRFELVRGKAEVMENAESVTNQLSLFL